jgi:hypothetical protein
VNPTPERPVIGVEAVLALADATAATLTPVAGDSDLPALDKLPPQFHYRPSRRHTDHPGLLSPLQQATDRGNMPEIPDAAQEAHVLRHPDESPPRMAKDRLQSVLFVWALYMLFVEGL